MSSPASILFIHSSDELYGSDVVLLELVRHLDPNRFRPVVVTPTDTAFTGFLGQALEESGIAHYKADIPVLRRRHMSPAGIYRFFFSLWKGRRQLLKLIAKENIALVHSNTSAVWGGALATRRAYVPHVWHIHEIISRPHWVKKLVAWMVANHCDHVVAISYAVANHLLVDQPQLKNRMSVIYDGVDTERFHPEINGRSLREEWLISSDEILIGVVGRISSWKGQAFFLQALAIALKQNSRIRAIIVGDSPPGEDWREEELRVLVKKLRIEDSVSWTGFRHDTPQVMAALDILVLPSIQPEPFGMVVVEAMSAGTPVIATAHGGPLESITNGITGLLIPPTDTFSMAEALKKLSSDARLRSSIGKNARVYTLENFTIRQNVSAFEELYEKLMATGTSDIIPSRNEGFISSRNQHL